MVEKIKIVCPLCGYEEEVDCTKFPAGIKSLDTPCKLCKAFIKFGNPNYVESAKNNKAPTLKEVVSDNFPLIDKDPSWFNEVYNCLKTVYGDNEQAAIRTCVEIKRHASIFDEFMRCAYYKNAYEFKNPLIIEGYSAKMIAEKIENSNPATVYMVMSILKTDKELGLKIINTGKIPRSW